MAAGPLQAAAGIKGWAEAAIHAMKDIFEEENTEAVILVDASNAFNSLNRKTALHNLQIIFPDFATILFNIYREPSRMLIQWGHELLSQEGTSQRDNVAMSLYALSTSSLQETLKISAPEVRQVWLADDATAAGSLANLRTWWWTIIEQGKRIGYHVNQSKSWIIINHEENFEEAKLLFQGTDIKVTTEGKRQLGATIGSDNFRSQYATEKILGWCNEIEKLSAFATTQPQAEIAAFIHGTIPGMEKL